VQTLKGPRQKTICSLGDLSPRPREEWLKFAHKLEQALAAVRRTLGGRGPAARSQIRRPGRENPRPAPAAATANGGYIAVDPSGVSTEQHREAGPVHAGYQFWNRLGLDDILRDVGLAGGTRRLSCASVLNRPIEPASEHATPGWIPRHHQTPSRRPHSNHLRRR
jgi:hypothetical protein